MSRILPLLLLLLVVGSAQAEPPYDVVVESANFEPGTVVNVQISGFTNQSFNVRITDSGGDIVAGRDTQLDVDGKYTFQWNPSSEGDFNATVTYSTGISITKKFLIQERVTSADIGQIYQSLYGVEARLKTLIAEFEGLVKMTIALGAMSLIISVGVGIYARKRVSPVDTEFTRLMKHSLDEMRAKRGK